MNRNHFLPPVQSYFCRYKYILVCLFLLTFAARGNAQRTFASNQNSGSTGICLACTVSNPTNADDSNLETYSTLNVTVGIAATTYQELIFPSSVAANTPVTVKLGSGDNLLSLIALGAVSIQAYSGATAIGSPTTASSLISVLSNNDQYELTLTPGAAYNRVRVTLNGGIVGALSSLYLYEAFYNSGSTTCGGPYDELNGISSGLLGLGVNVGGVVNPQYAIDGDITTYAVLNAGVGVAGAYTQETAIFPGLSQLGDSVRLILSVPQSLITAGVLSNVSITTFSGNTSNGDTRYLNSSALNVQILGTQVIGSTTVRQVVVSYAPASVFNRVQLSLGGGIASVLSTLNFYEAQKIIPHPVVSINGVQTNNATICAGSSATLTVATSANTQYNWYTSATGGTVIATGSTFTTPALNATTTYYVAANHTACTDQSARTAITINVNPIPAAPVVPNSTETICAGSTVTFTATNVSGITFNWYTTASGGTPVFTGNPFTTPALNATTSYYVEAVNGTCTSTTRTQVTATVNPLPAAPVVPNSTETICSGSTATFTANNVAGVTFNWYTSPTGGTPIFTGNPFTTPALNATISYYVEAVNGTCTSATRTQVTATVNPSPAAPVVPVNNQAICSGNTATFTANSVSGITYNWYTSATGGTPVFTGNPFTTPALNATTFYYVEAINGTCTSATRAQVTATVNQTPAAPAIAQTPVQICSGASVVLTASSAPGTTINWYTSATGGTPLASGTQFTTPALTSSMSYYAEASSGSCVSASRAEADVIVNPVPATPTFVVSPANAQINSGGTATITASNATPGTSFNWYTTATGGTPIYSGATFTTPILTSTTSYYIEGVSASGCASAQRAEATITVNPIFSTSCDFASSQSNTANGLCIGCSVSNPGGAVDADTTSSSHLNMTVAALGASVGQTVIFGDTGSAGDTITVKIGVPSTSLSAGVLSAIQFQSYNGATANSDLTSLSNSVVSVRLLTGNNIALIKFVPGGTFDRVQITLNGGIAAALSSLDIYYGSKQVSAPALTAGTINICSGGTATFTLNNPFADVTYNWYTSAVGGTLVFTGTSFTTPALSATTTYYVESSRTSNGCVNPNRVAATANVTPSPIVPVLSQNSVTICSGDNAQFTVTNAGSSTVNWYDAPTGGSLLFTGTVLNVSPSVTTSYYAELTNSSCVSSNRAQATVTVNPRPNAFALQNSNLSICSGSTATIQINNPQPGVNYNWYTTPTGGTAVFTGNTFITPVLTASIVYYAEAVNSTTGCGNTSGRVSATITVNPLPAAPTVIDQAGSSAPSVCSGSVAQLTASSATPGITFNWYNAATGGTLLFTGATFNTSTLTANTTYYVDAVTASGCTAAGGRTAVTVAINPLPAASTVTDQIGSSTPAVCSGSVAQLRASSATPGVTFNWYDAATGGTLLFTGATFNTPVLTANTAYYVDAVTASGCTAAGGRTAVTVAVNPLPAAPTVTDQAGSSTPAVCSGSVAQLKASSTTPGVTFNWYNAATGGTLLATGASYTTPPSTVTTTYYAEAVTVSGCTAAGGRTGVTVAVNPLPAAPTVTDQAGSSTPAVCSGNAAQLKASSTTPGVTFNWYNTATGGTLLASGANYTTPALTATTTYYVEDTNAPTGCVSAMRTPVTVTINPQPPAPVIANGSTVNSCSGLAVTLSIANPQPGYTYNWYTASSGGAVLSTGAAFVLNNVTSNISYYAEAVNSTGCTSGSRTKVDIQVNPLPVAPQVKDQAGSSTPSICSGNIAQLTATSISPGVTFNWYDAATGGALLFTGATFNTPALTANTTYYVQSVNTTGCVSATRSAVVVTVVAAPSTPQLTNASVSICPGSTATLTATTDPNTTVNWYLSPAGGTPIFTGQTFTTPALTSNTTYYVGAINGTTGCASSTRAVATVNMTQPLNAPVVTVGSTSATSVTFTWQAISGTVGYEVSLDNGQNFITPSSGATGLSQVVNNLQPGQSASIIVRAIGKTACELSANSSVATGITENPFADKLYIPNTFTPNGDGKNDVFMIYGTTIQKANLSVYNQWGELIFRTTDKSVGWDGTYKGRDQPVGVYVYYVEATMNDGRSITKKGTITLLR